MIDDKKVFFLTGSPRSGTTWLGMLLGHHTEISCKGEARVHWFGEGLAKLCKEYDQMLAERQPLIGKENEFPALAMDDFLAVMRAFVERRLRVCRDTRKAGLRFVGEKDPEHTYRMALMRDLFPEAQFIHIIRDGRDATLSGWHHNKRLDDQKTRLWKFDHFMEASAKEWSLRVSLARKVGKLMPQDKYFELRYEDLLDDTPGKLTQVLAFLGADASEAVVRRCVEQSAFDRNANGRKQGEADVTSFFRKGVAGEWRTELTREQIATFNKIAGPLLKELGYDLHPG